MGFPLHRGLNVTTWLPEPGWRPWRKAAGVGRGDLETIAGWGFDHVRLPVDEQQLHDRRGRRRRRTFDLLDTLLDRCQAAGLRVVLDLHRVRSHLVRQGREGTLFRDASGPQRLAEVWSDLADWSAHRSNDQLAYDLLNQVRAPDAAAWNRVLRLPLDAIRARQPRRPVLVGSCFFSDPAYLPLLELPADEALILKFHYYRPLLLTHYGCPYSRAQGYRGPIRYPGPPVPAEAVDQVSPLTRQVMREGEHWNEPAGPECFAALLAQPLRLARRRGHPLYAAELGCAAHAPPELRRRWLTDVLRVVRANGIPFCLWEYRGVFGLLDPDGRPSDLLPLLTGPGAVA